MGAHARCFIYPPPWPLSGWLSRVPFALFYRPGLSASSKRVRAGPVFTVPRRAQSIARF